MSDIQVIDGNIVFNNGDVVVLKDADAIKQQIKFRLLTFRGEWFRDRTLGIDYPRLTDKRFSPALTEQVIRAAVLGVPGVTSVTSVRVDKNDRIQTVRINVVYRDEFSRTARELELAL